MELYVAVLLLLPLPIPREAPPGAHTALVRLAFALDLSDDSERWDEPSWQSNVRWTRDAWRRCLTAPPSAAAGNLPPADLCHLYYQHASAFVAYVEAQRNMAAWLREEYAPAAREAGLRQSIWLEAWCVRTATYVLARRQGLQRLYELAGGDALPPPVPAAYLRRVDGCPHN